MDIRDEQPPLHELGMRRRTPYFQRLTLFAVTLLILSQFVFLAGWSFWEQHYTDKLTIPADAEPAKKAEAAEMDKQMAPRQKKAPNETAKAAVSQTETAEKGAQSAQPQPPKSVVEPDVPQKPDTQTHPADNVAMAALESATDVQPEPEPEPPAPAQDFLIASLNHEKIAMPQPDEALYLLNLSLKNNTSRHLDQREAVKLALSFFYRDTQTGKILLSRKYTPEPTLIVVGPWKAGDTRDVMATFLAAQALNGPSRDQYLGYMARLYYNGVLQDEAMEPADLAAMLKQQQVGI